MPQEGSVNPQGAPLPDELPPLEDAASSVSPGPSTPAGSGFNPLAEQVRNAASAKNARLHSNLIGSAAGPSGTFSGKGILKGMAKSAANTVGDKAVGAADAAMRAANHAKVFAQSVAGGAKSAAAVATNPTTLFVGGGSAAAVLAMAQGTAFVQTIGPNENICDGGVKVGSLANFRLNVATPGEVPLTEEQVNENYDNIMTWLMSTPFERNNNKPMSKEQAAGILANMIAETSVINPHTINKGGLNPTSTTNEDIKRYSSDGTFYVGIMQWAGGRINALADFATSKNAKWYDASIQMEFLKKEIDERDAMSEFFVDGKSATYYAGVFAGPAYEGSCRGDGSDGPHGAMRPCADPSVSAADMIAATGRMMTNAEKYASGFGGTANSIKPLAGASCARSTTGTPLSEAVIKDLERRGFTFVRTKEGFLSFQQYSGTVASMSAAPCGTVAKCGCGPTSLWSAMVALSGKFIEPEEIYAKARNGRMVEAGSTHVMAKEVAEEFGFRTEFLPSDVKAISDVLKKGGMVWMCGNGSDAPYYTGGGHCIVARGITPDGKWYFFNSADTEHVDDAYDPVEVGAVTKGAGFTAIYYDGGSIKK